MIETVTEYQLRLTTKAALMIKYAESLLWGSLKAAKRHKQPTLSTRLLGTVLLLLRVFVVSRALALRQLKFEESRPLYDWSGYFRA